MGTDPWQAYPHDTNGTFYNGPISSKASSPEGKPGKKHSKLCSWSEQYKGPHSYLCHVQCQVYKGSMGPVTWQHSSWGNKSTAMAICIAEH
uniref:Uncharacterized protein n=1 Tax=Anguilla anguilla TaxID=7936 RepID=A0A0E9WZX8_ANGAN